MLRNSDWKITWEPSGVALVLLDFDDLMDYELKLPIVQLADATRSDFGLRSVTVSRGNIKRRAEFTRRIPTTTPVLAWRACFLAISADPWALKGILRIQPRSGTARDYTAALLSSKHRPAFEDGLCESVHDYAFRIIPI